MSRHDVRIQFATGYPLTDVTTETETQIGALGAGHGPLIDADQPRRCKATPGLFEDLAHHGLLKSLAEFEMARGLIDHALTVRPFLDDEIAILVADDGGDGY